VLSALIHANLAQALPSSTAYLANTHMNSMSILRNAKISSVHQCNPKCVTCIGDTYNDCLICKSAYNPFLNPANAITSYSCKKCSEISGFTVMKNDSSKCVEICGDGFNLGYYECDDGNLIDGDGCSSDCEFEGVLRCVSSRQTKMEVCYHYVMPRFKANCFNKSNSLNLKFTKPMKIISTTNLTTAFMIKIYRQRDGMVCDCLILNVRNKFTDPNGYYNNINYNIQPQCDLDDKDVIALPDHECKYHFQIQLQRQQFHSV